MLHCKITELCYRRNKKIQVLVKYILNEYSIQIPHKMLFNQVPECSNHEQEMHHI
jgi:hypothetical protein